MRLITFFFSLLIIVAINDCHSQDRNLYLNYSKDSSKIGLTDGYQQIVPIIYNDISRSPLRDTGTARYTKYYFVKKDDKVGMINGYNKVIIPLGYDSLAYGNNAFIQYQIDNKWGLIDRNNNRLTPAEYDELSMKNDSNVIYNRNGLYGLMNLKFKPITTPRFSKLEEIPISQRENRSTIFSNHLFEATENGLTGIYDAKRDLFIPHIIDTYLVIKFHSKTNPSSDADYRFQNKKGNKDIIFNSDGELVFTANETTSHVVFISNQLSNSSNKNACPYLLVFNKDQSKVIYNLETKKHTEKHQEIAFLFDKIVAINKGNWKIMNKNFRILYESHSYLPSVNHYANIDLYKITTANNTPLRSVYFEETSVLNNSSPITEKHPFIYVFKKVKEIPKKSFDELQYIACKIGLLNYKTKQMIPPQYNQINWRVIDNRILFYAFKYTFDDDENEATCIQWDIYNENYKKIKSTKILDENIARNVRNWDGPYIFKNRAGKFGGFNEFGEQIFSSKYDYAEFLFKKNSDRSNELVYFVLGNKQKKGLYDLNGNEVFPIQYDSFGILHDQSLMTKYGQYVDWYDADLKLIADSCSWVNPHAHLIIQNGYLKRVIDNNIVVIDGSNTAFNGSKKTVVSNCLIDNTGKVIFNSKYALKQDVDGYYYTRNKMKFRVSNTGVVTPMN